jgi:Cu-Zn family superoxide dismutase
MIDLIRRFQAERSYKSTFQQGASMNYSKILSILTVGLLCAAPSYAAIGTAAIKGTAKDSKVVGSVSFMETDEGLQVEASVADVPPGKHGFHIHEKGDCSNEGNAAGGHFNPMNVQHGHMPKDGAEKAHSGDMGNIEVGADGTGRISVFLPGVYLVGKEPSVAGLSVILHEKEDDFGQPTGNAGGRIGCGIITIEDEGSSSAEAGAEGESMAQSGA